MKFAELEVVFDDGDVIKGRAVLEDLLTFNQVTKPQITQVNVSHNKSRRKDVDEVIHIICCSFNETQEHSWYSPLWGFEYKLLN